MPMDQLEERVLIIAARTFGVSRASVTAQSTPETIPSWDSLQQVHLVLALEEEFGIQFDVDEIAAMQALSMIVATVRERVAAV